jgi:hypothetical protein
MTREHRQRPSRDHDGQRWALLVPIKYPAGIGEHMVKLFWSRLPNKRTGIRQRSQVRGPSLMTSQGCTAAT